MKNGKIQTLYKILYGFLMGSWKSLYKRRKGLRDLKTQFDQQLKEELSDSVSSVGILIYRKKASRLRDYLLNMKPGEYLVKLN